MTCHRFGGAIVCLESPQRPSWRERRKAAGLTQRDAARRLDVGEGDLRYIERPGMTVPKWLRREMTQLYRCH